MEDRIVKLIEKLNGMRDVALDNFLSELELYTPQDGSIPAIERAGILHDLDRHISVLHMELKRIHALKQTNDQIGGI